MQQDADYESNDSNAYVHSTSDARSRTPSPLAGKGGKLAPKRQSTLRPSTKSSTRIVSDHEMDVDETEIDDIETASPEDNDDETEEDAISDEPTQSESESESEDSIEDWSESEASESPAGAKGKDKAQPTSNPVVVPSKPLAVAQAKRAQAQAQQGRKSTRKVSKAIAELEQELDELSLGEDDIDPDDSTVIVPNKKVREEAIGPGLVYVPGKGEVDPGKKKKR